MAHGDGAFNHCGGNAFAAHREVHVDGGEDFRVGGGPLGTELDAATHDLVATALQDQDHVISGAAARACQQQLMGRAAMFCPLCSGLSGSGAPSMASTWPLPVSAIKPMGDLAPVAPVQLTVHSIG